MRFFNYLFTILIILSISSTAQDNPSSNVKYGVFSFDLEVTLPGTTEEIFNAATGDISGWWDHSFSEDPKKIFIETKPGGGFWEIFDDAGNGVLHATVTGVEKGKFLRFVGPLGLADKAIHMVHTYTFTAVGNDSTLFKVEVHASGEIEKGIDAVVESVWHHFIFEQFKPYVEAGNHFKK